MILKFYKIFILNFQSTFGFFETGSPDIFSCPDIL